MLGNSRIAERLATFLGRLSSMDLVGYLVQNTSDLNHSYDNCVAAGNIIEKSKVTPVFNLVKRH
jgi:hypothetical protein